MIKWWILWWLIGVTYNTREPFLDRLNRELDRITIELIKKFDSYELDSDDFMYHYIPDTNTGNRKEISIDAFNIYKVLEVPQFKKWRYIRFNNADYVLAIQQHNLSLWREPTLSESSQFLENNRFWHEEFDGEVVDALMCIIEIKYKKIFHLAMIECNYDCFLRVFQWNDNMETMILETVKPLKMKGTLKPLKLCYIKSHYEWDHFSLIILFENYRGIDKIIEKSNDDTKTFVTIFHAIAPDAVDIEVFTVDGLDYVAMATRSAVHIYRLDYYLTSAEYVNSIKGEKIKDIETFRLGFKRFLAIAGSYVQNLYEWTTDGFFVKQNFSENGAKQWFSFSIPTCRDEVILLLLSNKLSVFVWHGEMERFIRAAKNYRELLPIPGTITSFEHMRKPYLLFFEGRKSSLVSINSTLKETDNPVYQFLNVISKEMNELKDMLLQQEYNMNLISNVLNHAVKPDTELLRVTQYFNKITIFGTLLAETLTYQNAKVKDSEITMDEAKGKIEEFRITLINLEDSVDLLIHETNDFVLIGEDCEITGGKKISGRFDISEIITTDLYLERVNDINVTALQNTLYFAPGTITFTMPLLVNTLEVENLNGLNINEDVMLTNFHQTITGSVKCSSILTVNGDITVSGNVNDLNIEDDLVILSEDRVVVIPLQFVELVEVMEEVVVPIIDGIVVEELNRTSLKIEGDQHVRGKLSFEKLLKFRSLEVQQINGKTLNFSNFARTDSTCIIAGEISFENVIFKESLIIENLNGLRIPDDLVQKHKTSTIFAEKIFSEVIADDVRVFGKVNDLNLPQDVITFTVDQKVEEYQVFTTEVIINNVQIIGLFDGINITRLYRVWKDFQESWHRTEKGSSINVEQLLGLNGTFEEFYHDLIFIHDEVVEITGSYRFIESFNVEDVVLNGKINSFNISKDFLLTKGDQFIRGKKTFKGFVTCEKNLEGRIKNVDLKYLRSNSISLKERNLIPINITFENVQVLNDLEVASTINSISFHDDVMLRSIQQTVTGKKTFFESSLNNLTVDNHLQIDFINNEKVERLLQERVTLDSNQELTGIYQIFHATVNNLNVLGSVNNLRNFTEFLTNVVSLSKNEKIYGEKTFTGTSQFLCNVTTRYGVNEINFADINSRAVRINDVIKFMDTMKFEEILVRGNLSARIVNEVDIQYLLENSVTQGSNATIYGKTEFLENFFIRGNLYVASINNIEFSNFLTKNTEQNITGIFTFDKVVLNGQLEVSTFISEINITELNESVLKYGNSISIHGNLNFLEEVIIENLWVTGVVNDLNGKIVFKNVTTDDPIYVEEEIFAEYINDMAFCNIAQDIVTIHGQHRISKSFNFDQVIVRSNVHVDGNVLVRQYVNNINIQTWAEDVVYSNKEVGSITGTKTIEGNVEMKNLYVKTINGIPFVNFLLVTSKDTQVITGKKTFENLHINIDIQLKGFFNGLNISDKPSFPTFINEIGVSLTHLEGIAVFFKNIKATTVHGINLQDLITLNSEQFIERMNFSKIKINNINVTGIINGRDVYEVEKFFKDEHMVTSVHTLITYDISVTESFNDHRPSIIVNDIKRSSLTIRNRKKVIERIIRNQTLAIERIEQIIKNSFTLLYEFIDCNFLRVSASKVVADQNTRTIHFYQLPGSEKVISFSFVNETRDQEQGCHVSNIKISKEKARLLLESKKINLNRFRSSRRTNYILTTEFEATHIALIENVAKLIVVHNRCVLFSKNNVKDFQDCKNVTSVELFSTNWNLFVVIGRVCTQSFCPCGLSAIYDKYGRKMQILPGRKNRKLTTLYSKYLSLFIVF
ncbi:uncharacterized protein [Centruroides vittatus]|uniref:uncharacterized protein n=1 Tax=Centruroides vittatus TaxID=120091 RepID=UPI003510A0C5